MDSARIALATLGSIVSGVVLGLAVHPTLRPMPEADWRARYRASSPAPPPPSQPGVTYFGDGSTAWAWGGASVRINDGPPTVRWAAWRDEPEQWTPPPPDLPREDFDAEASAAERAAAQAAVSAAVVRSAPQAEHNAGAATPADPGEQDESAEAAVALLAD